MKFKVGDKIRLMVEVCPHCIRSVGIITKIFDYGGSYPIIVRIIKPHPDSLGFNSDELEKIFSSEQDRLNWKYGYKIT